MDISIHGINEDELRLLRAGLSQQGSRLHVAINNCTTESARDSLIVQHADVYRLMGKITAVQEAVK